MFSVISNILKRLGSSFLVCIECMREGHYRKKGTAYAKEGRLEKLLHHSTGFEHLTVWTSFPVTLSSIYSCESRNVVIPILQMEKLTN